MIAWIFVSWSKSLACFSHVLLPGSEQGWCWVKWECGVSYLQKHTSHCPAFMRFIPAIANSADLSFVRKQSEVSSSANQNSEKRKFRWEHGWAARWRKEDLQHWGRICIMAKNNQPMPRTSWVKPTFGNFTNWKLHFLLKWVEVNKFLWMEVVNWFCCHLWAQISWGYNITFWLLHTTANISHKRTPDKLFWSCVFLLLLIACFNKESDIPKLMGRILTLA